MKRLGPIALFALLLTSGLLGAPLSATAQTQSSTGTPGDVDFWEELASWERIKDTSNPAEIEAYLSAYPNGRFRRLAELRLSSLRSGNAARRRGRTLADTSLAQRSGEEAQRR